MAGIFDGNGMGRYGSLGNGAPDTGRGNAYDRLAASRGYGPLVIRRPVAPGTPIPNGAFINVGLSGRPRQLANHRSFLRRHPKITQALSGLGIVDSGVIAAGGVIGALLALAALAKGLKNR